jgi:phage-related holin
MSIFEIIMLLCFGFAWPLSIYKSYKSRTTKGKSLFFLYVVLAGYIAGVLHKVFYHMDGVIVFYVINLLLVIADTILFYRNLWIEKHSGGRKPED